MSWAFVADSIHSRIRDTDIFFFSNPFDLFKNQLNLNSDGNWKNKNIIPHRPNPECPPLRNKTVSSVSP